MQGIETLIIVALVMFAVLGAISVLPTSTTSTTLSRRRLVTDNTVQRAGHGKRKSSTPTNTFLSDPKLGAKVTNALRLKIRASSSDVKHPKVTPLPW